MAGAISVEKHNSVARKTVALLLGGALMLSAAIAAGPSAKQRDRFGLSDPNAPIYLSADRSDADQNTKTLVYSGHAIVHQGDVYLHTDRLKVVAPDGKTPDKIYADGHVILTAPSGTATGERGVYDVNPRIITLTGNVVLTRGENVMRGAKLTINLISGVAHLAGAVADNPSGQKGGQKGRIQGMFVPRSLTNGSNGANSDAAGGGKPQTVPQKKP